MAVTGIVWSLRGKKRRLQHFIDLGRSSPFCRADNVPIQVDSPIDGARLCGKCVKKWIRINGRPWDGAQSSETQ